MRKFKINIHDSKRQSSFMRQSLANYGLWVQASPQAINIFTELLFGCEMSQHTLKFLITYSPVSGCFQRLCDLEGMESN